MSDKPVTLSSDEETSQSSASMSAKPPQGSPPKGKVIKPKSKVPVPPPPPPNPIPKKSRIFSVSSPTMSTPTIGVLRAFEQKTDDFEMWWATYEMFLMANDLDASKNEAQQQQIPYHETCVNYVATQQLDTLPVTADQIRKATIKDPVLSKVLQLVLYGWPPKLRDEDEAITSYFHRRLELTINQDVSTTARKSQANQEKCYNSNVKFRVFRPHDPVWVKTYIKGEEKWSMGKITGITGPVSFAVQVGDRVLKRHADQLRIAILPATAAASSSTSDDQDEQPSPPSST
ncbi:unnamed protein product [Orchesella dallaii]|uniref:Uncharacterized protein n=1 Tax=Orchesella dallaii TaxID=48710 RepID=A0ABP1RUY4_9HEXA